LCPSARWWTAFPYIWSSHAGQPTITFIFRVGQVDELFAHRGVSHAVEHLALNALHGAPYTFNGQVSSTTTVFTASGSPSELALFARALCNSLRNLQVDRLRRELSVLATEAQARPRSLRNHLVSLQCGYTPHGRGALPEFGLNRLRELDVAAWATTMFTRNNLTVWIAGEPPQQLAFDLPEGDRMPIPEAVLLPTMRMASCVTDSLNGVALSAVRPRALALQAIALALGERLRDRLRFREGISYTAIGNYEPLTTRTGHLLVMADCVAARAGEVVNVLVDILTDIATTGSIVEDLRPVLDGARRMYASPESLLPLLHGWAFGELLGDQPAPMASILREMARIDPDTIASTLSEALKEAMLVVPNGCSSTSAMFPLQRREPDRPVEGRRFRHRISGIFSLTPSRNCIVLGDAGVSRIDDHGKATTVLFAACAGLLKLSNGRRLLLGEDLQQLEIAPEDWRDGTDLVGSLDAAVPDDRIVWMA
jgi:predicted Zn-dependent peptidase